MAPYACRVKGLARKTCGASEVRRYLFLTLARVAAPVFLCGFLAVLIAYWALRFARLL